MAYDYLENERLFAVETREQQGGLTVDEMLNTGLPQPLGPGDSPTFSSLIVTNTVIAGGFSLPSFTAGSVLFIGAGGAFTQDNANLFFDDSLNRLRLLGLETKATSPAQITADQNDYDPGTGKRFRLDLSAAWAITGFAGGTDGREIVIYNISAFTLTIKDQNAGSAAANRIITGTSADLVLGQNDFLSLWYDSASARWRVE